MNWKEALQYLAWVTLVALMFPIVGIVGLWIMKTLGGWLL